MKKILGIAISVIILITLLACGLKTQPNTQYLRIHIRANSNLEIDQNVKYEIKDKLVDFLTPILSECETKEKAEEALKNNLENIEQIADKCLKAKGFNYKSNAKLNNEYFPTRTYSSLTLESGYYDALIVELGEAKGDNSWCVVYPPLCFTNSNSKVVYKSKIAEIIKNFIDKQPN